MARLFFCIAALPFLVPGGDGISSSAVIIAVNCQRNGAAILGNLRGVVASSIEDVRGCGILRIFVANTRDLCRLGLILSSAVDRSL